MNSNKPWYRQKTFWAGVIAIAGGLVKGFCDGDWDQAVKMIVAGFIAISLRQAVEANGPAKKT